MTFRLLFVQFMKFLGISGIGWLLDFALFNLLHLIFGRVFVCNFVSSIVAVTFVFSVSTRKTFVQKDGGIPLKAKFAVYIVYQIVLIFAMSKLLSIVNALLLKFIAETFFGNFSAAFAKILVTPVTMCLNFAVMKILVEKT